jgi:hypothetical protein
MRGALRFFISAQKVIRCERSDSTTLPACPTLLLARFVVVRYWNNEVLQNLDGVLSDLTERLEICGKQGYD